MSDNITITGTVATTPNTVKTDGGLAITHFRLASNSRRFDRASGVWVDGEPNFYSVSAFRQTAHNVLASLGVGDRIVVTGRLRVKEWTSGDRRGVTAEIDVDALGHDLTFGRTELTKVRINPDRQHSGAAEAAPSGAEFAASGEALGQDGPTPGTGAPVTDESDEVDNSEFTAVGPSDAEQGEAEGDAARATSDRIDAPVPF